MCVFIHTHYKEGQQSHVAAMSRFTPLSSNSSRQIFQDRRRPPLTCFSRTLLTSARRLPPAASLVQPCAHLLFYGSTECSVLSSKKLSCVGHTAAKDLPTQKPISVYALVIGHSVANTSTPSVQPSPTVNLTREFTLAVETHSYKEIRSIFDQESSFNQNFDLENSESEEPLLLEQVLQPSREIIQDALSLVGSYSLVQLVATCFEHSENTSRLHLHLYQRVRKAKHVYTPIHNLLDDLPLDIDFDSYSLTHSQCTSAFNIFLQFVGHENPSVPPEPHNFDHLRQSFSQFTKKVDKRLEKTQSRVHLRHHCSKGSSLCIIAAGVGVAAAAAAVAIATHALVAIVASLICPIILQSLTTGKEAVRQKQLNTAAKVAYFIHKELDTIDRLVALLHSDVENDKFLVHHGVDGGMNKFLIQEVLKQLRRNRSSFAQGLLFLEEHLFLCFASINRARSLLLQGIHAHQDHSPG